MKVLITGSSGRIGGSLTRGLKRRGYQITTFDLPDQDMRDYEQLKEAMTGQDAVIHLAWNIPVDNFDTGRIDTDNTLGFFNIYQAAVATGTKRIILASSVHADQWIDYKGKELLSTSRVPAPSCPYGAHKCFLEQLGRLYAQDYGLEVVCVRFGGVNRRNRPPKGLAGKSVWLSNYDCLSLVRACLESEKIPSNYAIVYGVSNNINRIHDHTNPFGWVPRDGAKE
jgi:uronate dehydrogenase